ncbi:MAG TPA: lasso peptide biosynthesis B2 protein [Vicinamibacterales bacterium]
MSPPLAIRVRRVLGELETADDLRLGIRILGATLFVRVAKHVLPLHRLVALMTPTPGGDGVRDPRREARIARMAGWAARAVRPFGEGNCLERSLVVYRELVRAHAMPQLHMGFKSGASGVEGHAWVVLDGRPICDSAARCAEYGVAMTFSPGRSPVRTA